MDIHNDIFGGKENSAHFERDGVSITIGADVFWDMVAGRDPIIDVDAETSLIINVADCLNASMPIKNCNKIRLYHEYKKLFDVFEIVIEKAFLSYHVVAIDGLIFFCPGPSATKYQVTCLKTKISAAVSINGHGDRDMYVNNNEYIHLIQSIEDFIFDLFASDEARTEVMSDPLWSNADRSRFLKLQSLLNNKKTILLDTKRKN